MRVFEPYNPANWDPKKISPSRLNSLVQCGTAFEMKYLQGLPEEQSGSASLFGSVMHEALEKWAPNRKAPLIQLVRAAWLSCTAGTVVADFLGAYAALSVRAIRMEQEVRDEWAAQGKESKAPRMTAQFKKSDVARAIGKLQHEYYVRLNEGSPWKFTEYDPLPSLYDESLVLAKRYEAKWKGLPAPLYVELAFDVRWRHDFLLRGHIDAIEPLLNKKGDVEGILVTDYKTYKNPPAPAKDERQLVIYDVVVRELIARGEIELPDVPIFVCMDYVRLFERHVAAVTTAGYDKLERELLSYEAIVTAGAFLPAEKGRNPDYCGYGPDKCCLTCPTSRDVEVSWPS